MMSWKEVMENFHSSIDLNLYLIVIRSPQEPLGYTSPLGYQHTNKSKDDQISKPTKENQMTFTLHCVDSKIFCC